MMYYFLLAFAYLIAILPFRLLYMLSDLLCFLLYRVAGYRKGVVLDNLRTAFPEQPEAAIKNTARRFYSAFCDQWLETVKLLTMSEKELRKRFTGNWELFAGLAEQHKNVYALLGHRFNWEWANAASSLNSPQQFAGIYLPVHNKAFDRLMLKIRRRTGSMLIPADRMRSHLRLLNGQQHIIGFIADQSPGNLKDAYWYHFLNRPAPFISGSEKAAMLAGAAVVYAGIHRVKRGYYTVRLELLTDNARHMPPEWITRTYLQKLQQDIQSQPYNWLWTHKRWKHQPGAETVVRHL